MKFETLPFALEHNTFRTKTLEMAKSGIGVHIHVPSDEKLNSFRMTFATLVTTMETEKKERKLKILKMRNDDEATRSFIQEF